MSNLKCKTRGNSSPQGKPRVYFCCHPEDFNKYFESVSDEILAKQNCTIWYDDEELVRNEDFFADLKQMQLFVMPVTTNLLCTENKALDTEFKFAIENHIPVLPLMQEGGLEELFNKKCGDLQFLDKNNTDVTAISYDEKLKKYLESVLIGDELAEKIRAAFDAYVFLSYRKKDRKYAQELMRLIHKNEFCRDIAIWYDEFLTPGENFNDSIKEALQKSGLFVLTVTPNIVNEPNYIMTTEYPMAKQEGKPILPAELVPTDREQLSKKYEDIPNPADAHNESELSEALLESIKKMAIKENDASPEHEFFIGLAYLNGIDVEVDTEKAIKLIEHAASSGLVEAAEKLVSIYSLGQGVERDTEKAVRWQEGLLHCSFNKAERNCYVFSEDQKGNIYSKYKKPDIRIDQLDIESIIRIASNMNKLFEMYATCGPFWGFDNYGNEFSDHSTVALFWDLEKNVPHTMELLPVIARRYDLWGDYYATLGNRYGEAIFNINKGYKLKKKYCDRKQLVYEQLKFRLKKIKLYAACGMSNKVIFTCKKDLLFIRYYEAVCKMDLRKFTAEFHYYIADALFNKECKKLGLLKKHLNIANKLCLELQEEGQKTYRLLAMIYEITGKIFETNKDYSIANKNYIAAYEYSQKNMVISADMYFVLQHIQICENLAIMCLYENNDSRLGQYLDEMNKYFNYLYKYSYSGIPYYNALSKFWYLKGLYTNDDLLINKSMQLYEGLLESSTKKHNRARINNPKKRFGLDIVDLFSYM